MMKLDNGQISSTVTSMPIKKSVDNKLGRKATDSMTIHRHHLGSLGEHYLKFDI